MAPHLEDKFASNIMKAMQIRTASIAVVAVLGVLGFASIALAGHNPAVVEHELGSCGPTVFSATVTDPAGTHLVSNMFLVVDTEDGDEQFVNIPTDGSAATIEVGPFETDTTVSWHVFGGGERDYDQPLWNGYGGATFGDDITDYFLEVGTFSWVVAGTDDPNPFVTWNEVLVPGCVPTLEGGGHILEGDGKRKDWKDVSFGTEVLDVGGGDFEGHLNVVFHNTSDADVDKGHFHGTDIEAVNLFDGNSALCHAALNMTVNGTFDGEDGWSVIFRAGDSPTIPATPHADTVRVELKNPSNVTVYDTHSGDFTDESSCVGTARTGLDTGNLTINL